MSTIACVLVLCLFGLAKAQIPSWGRCSKPPVVANLNITKITGVWYEFERYYTFFERGVTCNKANYTENSPKGCIKIEAIALRGDETICYKAIAHSPDPKNMAKMIFKPLRWFAPARPFWLIDTDYKTHAIFYSCLDMYFMHWDIIWVKSRQPEGPSAPIVAQINRKLSSLGFRPQKLLKIIQTGCHYTKKCAANVWKSVQPFSY